jgi:hypothetical protein
MAMLASARTQAAVIAANNFPRDQIATNGWQEVGMDQHRDYSNSAWGQSFIATASGLLTHVETLLGVGSHLPEPPNMPPLLVEFSESQDGFPTDMLGAVSYVAEAFDSVFASFDQLTAVVFTSFAIPIHAGREYIVTYRSPFGVPFVNYDAPYYVGLVLDNSIPFGRLTTQAPNGINWERSPPPTPPYTFELATRIWVTPEPATASLLLVMLAAFNVWRIRR